MHYDRFRKGWDVELINGIVDMEILPIIKGLAITLVSSTVFLSLVFFYLPSWLKQDNPQREDLWLSAIVGVIERIIYFFSAYFGVYEFLGGWLVLKSVANFKQDQGVSVLRSYYVYLLGTGTSLIFGVGGAIATRYMCGLPIIP